MEPINYIVVIAKNSYATSVVRPTSQHPSVVEGEQIVSAILDVAEAHIRLYTTPNETTNLITSKERKYFQVANIASLTAFGKNPSIANLSMGVRINDCYDVPHNINLVLQKTEAVNPYKPKE